MRNKFLAAALMGAAMLGAPAMGGTARAIQATTASPAKVKATKGRVPGGSGRKGNRSGKRYPFSSDRQHARHAAFQYTAIVNGFPLMQTSPRHVAADRAFENAYGTPDAMIPQYKRDSITGVMTRIGGTA